MLPWFTDYCDFYQSGGAIQLAGITRAFLRFHLVGVPLGLAILGYAFVCSAQWKRARHILRGMLQFQSA
jgi:hypothetical protein